MKKAIALSILLGFSASHSLTPRETLGSALLAAAIATGIWANNEFNHENSWKNPDYPRYLLGKKKNNAIESVNQILDENGVPKILETSMIEKAQSWISHHQKSLILMATTALLYVFGIKFVKHQRVFKGCGVKIL